MIHMEYYLVVSTIMFFAGIYGFFTRRNLLAILISIELILNSVDINFAVFNSYLYACRPAGGILFHFVCHRNLGGGDGCRYCYNH